MRILVTADLHYDVARSMEPTEYLATHIVQEGADALVIVGDACSRDLGILRRCFALFDRFAGRVFYVAGNHDLWTCDERDSLQRHEHDIAQVCDEAGVWYLDARPFVDGEVAIAGTVGWYDYTFRRADLGIPLRFYRHKVGPGAARLLGTYSHLFDDGDALSDAALAVRTRWMDGVYARLPMSDMQFTRRLHDRLAEHLAASASARHVLVAVHHLPFEAMVHRTGDPGWDFANAFMGSELFGELLLRTPNVRHVVCGHSHRRQRYRRGPLECVNIGCTYSSKRFDVIELG